MPGWNTLIISAGLFRGNVSGALLAAMLLHKSSPLIGLCVHQHWNQSGQRRKREI